MSGAVGCWPDVLHLSLNSVLLRSFLLENASWNCAFRMLALSVESSCRRPADIRGGILLLNVRPESFHAVCTFDRLTTWCNDVFNISPICLA